MKFTQENQDSLARLVAKLTLAGQVLAGKLGANTLTPFDIINNLDVTTLRSILKDVNGRISATEQPVDRWSEKSSTTTQKLQNLKDWAELIDLTIGYKLSLAKVENQAKKAAKLRQEIAELRDATLTPTERLAALEAELAEIG